MKKDKKKNIGIVGGGIGGMALGYFLLKKGYRVTIFEKDSDIGGLSQSTKLDKYRVEKYYHHFFESDSNLFWLLSELNLGKYIVSKQVRTGNFQGGGILPFSGALDLLKYSDISFRNRLKLGLFLIKIKFRFYGLNQLNNISAVSWAEKECGRKNCEAIFSPLLFGKFGKNGEFISASWLFSRLESRLNSKKLFYIRGGLVRIFDTLTKKILKMGGLIYTKSEVCRISGKKICLKNGKKCQGFDKIILTVGNDICATTIDGFDDKFPFDERIKSIGNVCLVLLLKRKICDYYWLNVNEINAPFSGAIFQSSLYLDKIYGEKEVVYLSKYCTCNNELFLATDNEIFKTFASKLGIICNNYDESDILEWKVFRDRYSQPVFEVGGYKKILPHLIGENLYLMNMEQIYPADRGIEQAIFQAKKMRDIVCFD